MLPYRIYLSSLSTWWSDGVHYLNPSWLMIYCSAFFVSLVFIKKEDTRWAGLLATWTLYTCILIFNCLLSLSFVRNFLYHGRMTSRSCPHRQTMQLKPAVSHQDLWVRSVILQSMQTPLDMLEMRQVWPCRVFFCSTVLRIAIKPGIGIAKLINSSWIVTSQKFIVPEILTLDLKCEQHSDAKLYLNFESMTNLSINS